jgi:hypothetical protein
MTDKIVCDANNILDPSDNNINNEIKCAPGIKYTGGSCFSTKQLVSLIRAYNKYMKEQNVNKHIEFKWNYDRSLDGGDYDEAKYKKYLLKKMNTAMNDVCSDQLCWLKQKFIKKLDSVDKNDIINTLRPKGPTRSQGKFTWLNTTNIDKVMNQYHSTYPDFKFLGTVPVDFDDLEEQYRLSDINYNKLLKQGVSKIGAIFNLDYHYQSGSHWVGLFADLKRGEVNFFDSYGSNPPKRIKNFMHVLSNFYTKQTGKPAKENINNVRHQYGGSECGVYSINFVIRSLTGESFRDISNSKVKDEHINMCRDIYFRN